MIDALPGDCADLGEGPVWHATSGCLFWVDIMRGLVHRYEPSTGITRTYPVGQPVGAVAGMASGDLLLALRDGFGRLDLATGAVETTRPLSVNHECGLRMNDGKCDRRGRFWAGSLALDRRPHVAALHRLDADGTVHTMLTGVTTSNGLDWSGDDRHMYYIDSRTRTIDVFDFDLPTGRIDNRRPFVRLADGEGTPDGLTVDADGYVWVALWDGGAVRRYAPDGTLKRTITMPVSRPTSCTFGGPDLRDLYITTASTGLSADARAREPLAGRVLRCRPGPAGRHAHIFAG